MAKMLMIQRFRIGGHQIELDDYDFRQKITAFDEKLEGDGSWGENCKRLKEADLQVNYGSHQALHLSFFLVCQ